MAASPVHQHHINLTATSRRPRLNQKSSHNGANVAISPFKSVARSQPSVRRRPLRLPSRISTISTRITTPKRRRPLHKLGARLRNSCQTEKTLALVVPAGRELLSLLMLVERVREVVLVDLERRDSESCCSVSRRMRKLLDLVASKRLGLNGIITRCISAGLPG